MRRNSNIRWLRAHFARPQVGNARSAAAVLLLALVTGLSAPIAVAGTIGASQNPIAEAGGITTITITPSIPVDGEGIPVSLFAIIGGGSATAGDDFVVTAINGVALPPNDDGSVTLVNHFSESLIKARITAVNDSADELNETIPISALSTETSDEFDDVTVTITDDDAAPSVSLPSSATVDEDAGTMSLPVSLSEASSKTVTVDYATADGTGANTAEARSDYTAKSGTLTFTAGQTLKTISVTITNDTNDEYDETFTVSLSSPSNAALGSAVKSTVTITDNDSAPTVSMSSLYITIVSERVSTQTQKVRLSTASGKAVAVDYATADGTAVAGEDYESASGTLRFEAGEDEKTISVTILSDTKDEYNESYTVSLSNPSNATLGTRDEASLTIVDDDPSPAVSLSLSSPSIEEGESATVTARLGRTSGEATAVTVSASAVSPATASDFTLSGNSLSIAAGDSASTGPVTITADCDSPGTKTVTVSGAAANVLGVVGDPDDVTLTLVCPEPPEVTLSPAYKTVSEGAGTVSLTVRLSKASSKGVTVDYATVDGTADAGSDYTAKSGTLTFGETETSKTISVSILNDSKDEYYETFTVSLSSPSDATLGSVDEATVTITDNDPAPVVSLSASKTVREDAGTVSLTVSLNRMSSKGVTVDYATAGGTADAGSDYTAKSGTLTFGETETSKTISVSILDDSVSEDKETITLSLSSPSDATLGSVDEATVTITDNDPAPVVSLSASKTVREDVGTVSLTVSLNRMSSKGVTVDYATAGGTADAGSDYTAKSGTLTFGETETSKTISVSILNDPKDEYYETFTVSLSSPSNATLGSTDEATVTIEDDDPLPKVSLSSSSKTVDEGTSTVSLTVSLSADSGKTVTVDYATADGAADAGSDYTAKSGTLTFDPGDRSETITVSILNDPKDEYYETFTVSLSSPSDATLGSVDEATVTITDNDPAPVVSLSASKTVREDAGTVSLTVSLNRMSSKGVTVDYATAGGTADAGSDYTAKSGTLTFGETETSKTISVSILDDSVSEDKETITLSLSSPSDATLGSVDEATVTITDNDPAPVVSLSASKTVREDVGTVSLTVSLNRMSSKGVTVDYATAGGTADAGSDYTAKSGTLTFGETETSKTISVSILNDPKDEYYETFTVSLSSPSDATLGSVDEATVTITDNDPAPVVSLSASKTVREDVGTVSLTVSLNRMSSKGVTVDYATAGGTADAGSDYTAKSGTLTFGETETSKTISVSILDDSVSEDKETITLSLSSPSNATLGSTDEATVTIEDDDPLPKVSLSSSSKTVDEGTSTVSLTVSLSADSGKTVTVDYATADGAADAGSDYTAKSGTLTFDPGDRSETITVSILNDPKDEYYETFTVSLSSPSDATLGSVDEATVTITDNDPAPVVSLSASKTVREDAGTVSLTVSLNRMSSKGVTVDYATAGGTADAGSDYTAKSGTLTFGETETSKTISVSILDDSVSEDKETITLSLSSPSDATLGSADEATVTIVDNEPSLSVSFSSATYTAEEGGSAATVTVELSEAPGQTITIPLESAAQGGATAQGDTGADHSGIPSSVTFGATDDSKSFMVRAEDDAIDDDGESVDLSFGTLPDGVAAGSQATASVTLEDNDVRGVEISESGLRLYEGESGAYTVKLTSQPARTDPVTVEVSVSNGGNVDVTALPAILTFTAQNWSAAQTVTVAVDQDTDALSGEATVSHVVDGADYGSNGVTADPVTVWVWDDDVEVQFSASSYDAEEGGSAAEVVVTLNASPTRQVVIPIGSVAQGGATAQGEPDADYSGIPGSVTFGSYETEQRFSVAAFDDAEDDDGESVDLSFGTVPKGVSASSPDRATVKLIDDDVPLVTASFGASSYAAKEGGSTASVTVSLSAEPEREVEILLVVTRKGGASSADYSGIPSSVTFAADEDSKAFVVTATDDTVDDDGESVSLSFGTLPEDVSGGTQATTEVELIDDDDPPGPTSVTLSASLSSVGEESGTTSLTVTGTLDRAATEPTDVALSVSNGTADAQDYTAVASTISIAAGATTATAVISLTPVDDDVDEVDETVVVGATAGDLGVTTATVTIVDDDTRGVEISETGLRLYEGESGAYTVVLTSQPAGTDPVTVDVAVRNGGNVAVTAVPARLTFTADDWATAQIVTVAVQPDADALSGEATVRHTVGGSDYGSNGLTTDSVTVWVYDDDVAVQFSAPSYEAREGGSAKEVVVTLNAAPTRQVVIPIGSVAQGGATAQGEPDADYSGIPGSVTFGSYETEQRFSVMAFDDAVDDDGDSVDLSFGTMPKGVVAGGRVTATVTIKDNDVRGVAVTPPSLSVDEADTAGGLYTVVLTSQPAGTDPVTVTIAGAADTDLTLGASSLTFTQNNWAAAQEVTVKAGLDVDRDDEAVTLSHSAAGADYAGVTGSDVVVTVIDTHPAWSVTVSPGAIAEAGGTAVVTVSTGGLWTYDTEQAITLAFRGAAAVGDDFTLASSLTLPAEMTSVTAEIAGVDDILIEGDERAVIAASHGGMEVASGEVTISDDDTPQWSVAVDDDSLDEDAGESATVTVRITNGKTYADAQTITLTVTGTAEVDADFTLVGVAHTPETGYTLQLGAESDSVTATITAVDDLLADTSETVNLALSRDDVAIGSVTVTITDDDAPVPSVCARTDQVRDAIVAASPVDACALVGKAHLAAITELDARNAGITALQATDFSGLDAVAYLWLQDNQLTALPAGVFDGLAALEWLYLSGNDLTELPAGIFDDLTALETLSMASNELASFPAGVLDHQSTLRHLYMSNNRLTELPAGIFSHTPALEIINLSANRLEALPEDLFDGLTSLGTLTLWNNQLSALPHGVFEGLPGFQSLSLARNPGAPFSLEVSLAKEPSDGEFKAVIPAGAPFAMRVRLSVSEGGSIDGNANRITIPAGAVESAPLSVSRQAGAAGAVTVDIDRLPGRPSGHTGYTLQTGPGLPLEVLPDGPTLSALSLSDGTLTPAFASETTAYGATVSNAVSQVTVTATAGDATATVAYLDGAGAPLPDADAGAAGYQVDLAEGRNPIRVKVTAADGVTAETYALTVTRAVLATFSAAEYWATEGDAGVTVEVRLSAAPGLEVTIPMAAAAQGGATAQGEPDADYSGIPVSVTFAATATTQTFNVTATADAAEERGEGVALRFGTLPEGVEAGDLVATAVQLSDACSRTEAVCRAIEAALGAGSWGEAAARLNEVTELALDGQSIEVLTAGDFAGLSGLTALNLLNNGVRSLPAGIFDDLTALERLYLGANSLTELPVGVFDELSLLAELDLTDNALASLPAGVFDELALLTELNLTRNALGSLPPDVFDHVPLLFALDLSGNRITQVTGDVFSGLTNLTILSFSSNQLSVLPAGVFEGLSGLNSLSLGGNAADPLPLGISLEKVADGEFKAAAATGAPFAITLPLEVAGPGTLDGGASTITVDAGGVASAPLTVTRTAGTIDPVTVRIGTLPDRPPSHSGYALQKGPGLPLTVIPAAATLSALTVSDGTLDPVFAPQDTSYTAAVASTVAQITVSATPSDATDTVAYLGAAGAALSDADANTAGHQVDLEVGGNTIQAKVTLADASASRTYTLAVTRATPPVWSVAVRPATIGEAAGAATLTVSAGGVVFAEDQTIALSLTGTATPGDDFTVQSGGATLTDPDYDLTLAAGAMSVTAAITAGEDSTAETDETVNIAASHGGASIGTAVLTITDGICGRTEQVRDAIVAAVQVNDSGVTGCGDVTAAHLAALDTLGLSGKSIAALAQGDFAGLSAVATLYLGGNQLGSVMNSLPAGVFGGLPSLEQLFLGRNPLGSRLTAGVFDGLGSLTNLSMGNAQLSSLPEGILDGLTSLESLGLASNQLAALPNGVFEGLTSLTALYLGGNAADPLRLTVTLEKVGEDQFKAVMPSGAPFAVAVPVTVASGTVSGSANATVTIAKGAVASGALTVSRTAGTTAAVTAAIGTLPGRPPKHFGYALVESGDLPLEVLAEVPVVAIEALSAQVSEAAGAVFTLTRTGPATEPLTVTVNVTEEGSVLQTPSPDGSAITETATFAEDMPTATLTVATDDDATDEELTAGSALAGRIAAAVQSGTGYVLDSQGNTSATVDIEDNDPAVPVTPPAAEALVSNLGQTAEGGRLFVHSQLRVSQAFTTGLNTAGPGGYRLASVEVSVGATPDDPGGVTVSIRSAPSAEPQYVLTNPTHFSVGVNTFTAPAGATLDPDATYYVVLDYTGSQRDDFQLHKTTSGAEDAAGADGWSIADPASQGGSIIMMRVNGYAIAASSVLLSVADAQAQEAPSATLDFEVTLNYTSAAPVTVQYRTLDGTAVAGINGDYEHKSGTLTFAPGETTHTVLAPVHEDPVDDDGETMTLLLFDASGAGVERAQAVGTINNSDPLPMAWLVRFGRTVASHVAEGIGERLMQTERVRPHASIAGLRLPFGESGAPANEPTHDPRDPGQALPWDQEAGFGLGRQDGSSPAGRQDAPMGSSHGLTSRDLLLGSSFLIKLGGPQGEGALSGWTLWGRGMATRFDGSEDELKLDGEVTTYMVGADTAWDRWLAGVALARSRGGGGYDASLGDRTERGELTSSLTSVHPYVRVTVSERMSAWGVLGYGRGGLTLNRGDAGTWDTDTSMQMAALGARGVLTPATYTGGFELAVRSDVLWSSISSGASETADGRLAGSEGDAGRLRLILQGSRSLTLAGNRTLTPNIELGLRHDAGDAETGTGVELGGGLRYADPTLGLSVEVKGRSLIAHADSDYSEWGASAAIRLNPGATGQGLLLTLTPSWGSVASRVERLWSQRDAQGLAGYRDFNAAGRLDAEIGYALSGPRGMGTQTPYAAVSLGDTGGRTLRVGWRLAMGPRGNLDLEGMRRQSTNGNAAENSILMRAAVRW